MPKEYKVGDKCPAYTPPNRTCTAINACPIGIINCHDGIVTDVALTREEPLSRAEPHGKIANDAIDTSLRSHIERGICLCTVCEGKGWLIAFNTSTKKLEIQKCDTCDRYDNDEQAEQAMLSQLAGMQQRR